MVNFRKSEVIIRVGSITITSIAIFTSITKITSNKVKDYIKSGVKKKKLCKGKDNLILFLDYIKQKGCS